MKNEFSAYYESLLSDVLDDSMLTAAFTRDRFAHDYVRETGELTQVLGVEPYPPHGSDKGRYGVQSTVAFRSANVAQVMATVFSEGGAVDSQSDGFILVQPLCYVAPTCQSHVPIGRSGLPDGMMEVRDFMLDQGIAFFDEFTGLAALADACQAHDSRLVCSKQTLLSMVAANVFVGRPREALRLLKQHFSQAGPRRIYGAMWDHVEGILASSGSSGNTG